MRAWQTFGKQVLRHGAFLLAFGGPAALVGGQGCTLAGDFCDAYCECERCNDREEDDCNLSVGAIFDVADAYDCTAEADAYFECAIADNDCDDNVFSVDDGCQGEIEDLFECIDDNSDLIGSSSGPGPGPDQGPGPGGGTTVCACVCTCTMCTINDATRTCAQGEGGCESCDVVCGDACLADDTCGGFDSAAGQCATVP